MLQAIASRRRVVPWPEVEVEPFTGQLLFAISLALHCFIAIAGALHCFIAIEPFSKDHISIVG